LAAFFFHNSLKIARPVQDAEHLNGVWRHAIKENMTVNNNAPQTWGKFFARSADFRQQGELPTTLIDRGGEAFRRGWTVLIQVIEDVREVALGSFGSCDWQHLRLFPSVVFPILADACQCVLSVERRGFALIGFFDAQGDFAAQVFELGLLVFTFAQQAQALLNDVNF
jgi:hypothetical protein